MENKKWGYLRETREMVAKAQEKYPDGVYTGLEDYLEVIYPGKTWIHDQPFGEHGNRFYKIRPDYLCEEEKLIVEFDGLQHYTNPVNIRKDEQNQKTYESFGYKVIRIPYFVQLTKEVVLQMFGIDVQQPLFDPELPSMSVKWSNTPAFCCIQDVSRMASELHLYPQQYDVNLRQLLADDDEDLSGVSWLRLFYESQKTQAFKTEA